MHIQSFNGLEVTEFNDVFLENILEKLSYENKEIIIMDDFNIDILKYDTNSDCANVTPLE